MNLKTRRSKNKKHFHIEADCCIEWFSLLWSFGIKTLQLHNASLRYWRQKRLMQLWTETIQRLQHHQLKLWYRIKLCSSPVGISNCYTQHIYMKLSSNESARQPITCKRQTSTNQEWRKMYRFVRCHTGMKNGIFLCT